MLTTPYIQKHGVVVSVTRIPEIKACISSAVDPWRGRSWGHCSHKNPASPYGSEMWRLEEYGLGVFSFFPCLFKEEDWEGWYHPVSPLDTEYSVQGTEYGIQRTLLQVFFFLSSICNNACGAQFPKILFCSKDSVQWQSITRIISFSLSHRTLLPPANLTRQEGLGPASPTSATWTLHQLRLGIGLEMVWTKFKISIPSTRTQVLLTDAFYLSMTQL